MNSKFRFFDLEGKTLVLTGATRGIGCALLPILLEQGMNLVVVGRGMDRMRALRQDLGAGEVRMRLFECDLTDPAAVRAAAAQILESGLALDGIFNNAGITVREHFSCGDDALWNQVFQVNLFSAASLTRLLLPRVQRSPQGRILFTGSVLFDLGGACMTAYSATKGALVGLTRSLAHELKHSAITVNCVVPGAIHVGDDPPTPEQIKRFRDLQSVSRPLIPADLAGLVCLLLSEAGGAINAQTIKVDGGLIHPIATPEIQGRTLNPPWPL